MPSTKQKKLAGLLWTEFSFQLQCGFTYSIVRDSVFCYIYAENSHQHDARVGRRVMAYQDMKFGECRTTNCREKKEINAIKFAVTVSFPLS